MLSSSNFGLLLIDMGKYENAKEIFTNNLSFFKKINNIRLQGLAQMDLSIIYFQIGNYKKSLEIIKKSISKLKKTEDLPHLTKALIQKTKVLRKLGELSDSDDSIISG